MIAVAENLEVEEWSEMTVGEYFCFYFCIKIVIKTYISLIAAIFTSHRIALVIVNSLNPMYMLRLFYFILFYFFTCKWY